MHEINEYHRIRFAVGLCAACLVPFLSKDKQFMFEKVLGYIEPVRFCGVVHEQTWLDLFRAGFTAVIVFLTQLSTLDLTKLDSHKHKQPCSAR
jgi:hypothetical protein